MQGDAGNWKDAIADLFWLQGPALQSMWVPWQIWLVGMFVSVLLESVSNTPHGPTEACRREKEGCTSRKLHYGELAAT